MYLAFKSYQVDKALISIFINVQELIQLIEIEYLRVKVSLASFDFIDCLPKTWR